MARSFNTPPLPLEGLRLHPRHHAAAIWWLGWLYRNPFDLRRRMEQFHGKASYRVALVLVLHALPWMLLISLLLTNAPEPTSAVVFPKQGFFAIARANPTLVAVLRVVFGCVQGFFTGLLLDRIFKLRRGAFAALFSAVSSCFLWAYILGGGSLITNLVLVLLWGTDMNLLSSRRETLVFGSVSWILIWSGHMVFFKHLPSNWFWWLFPLCFFLGGLRAYYLPLHALCFLFSNRFGSYRAHPVAWDWRCVCPLPYLDRLLVRYAEIEPSVMALEIARVISEIPEQRMAALRALSILRAKSAAQAPSLHGLSAMLADLPEGKKGFLSETRRVRELVEVIVHQQLRLDSTSRAYFREIEARNLVAEIRNFQGRVSGMMDPLATEFRKAAEAWLRLAETQAAKSLESLQVEPTPQVFRAGDSVARDREAFLPRFRVMEEIEAQIVLGNGCSGVLLRAPRRMGKSSLLKNLAGYLPKEVTVAPVSLQSAQLFSSTGHFVDGLIASIERNLPPLPEFESLRHSIRSNQPASLVGFLGFLDDCNMALERAGHRVLLALDEYEMLDEKLREGIFTRDLLATLRESIQSHRRIVWAFSGNADITELTAADWTSYLISVQTLEVPLFTPEETHLLLTEPLMHSGLREEDKAKSALFWREYWGKDGISRIHAQSGGWPYFVQLIAETVVTLTNDSLPSGQHLPPGLVERALDESVSRGRNALQQLMRSQCRVRGEWEYLEEFARKESQPPPSDMEVRRHLKRRQLLRETTGGGWQLVVPLMARWLRKEC